MRKICFLLGLFFVLSTHLAQGQDSIWFLNTSGRQVHIQKRTLLEVGSFPYVIDTTGYGYQSIPLQFTSPTILHALSVPPRGPYGTADAFYYLFKSGDSLIISLDEEHKPVFTHVSNPVRTEELLFFQRHRAYTGIDLPYTVGLFSRSVINKQLWGDDLRLRDPLLDSLYRPYIQNLDAFCRQYQYSDEMSNWFRYFYLGSLYGDKLYSGRKADLPLQQKLLHYYKDSLDVWMNLFDCNSCENMMPYNLTLRQIASMLYRVSDEDAYLESVAELQHARNRSFLLSRYVYDRLELSGSPDRLIRKYAALCNDTIYTNTVFAAYEKFLKQKRPASDELAQLMRADETVIGFNELLARLKGKVVYIDFWASWCQPCIAEFPASQKLQQRLKNEQIAFIYLSVDDDKADWLTAQKIHGIAGHDSFLLLDAQKSKLAQWIELGPIPRYIIIDKKGTIARMQAPRPSDPEIEEALSEAGK